MPLEALQSAINASVDARVDSRVDTQVPPLIPPPVFRFDRSGLGLGGVVCYMLADRAATLKSIGIVADALTSATALKVQVKKNGANIGAELNLSTTMNFLDLSPLNVPIVAGDKITVVVSTMTLVIGLGTVYGFIKTS